MSTFVLNRNYELQLPTSFVDIDRDEMEYVDGGIGFYISKNNAATMATYVYGGGFGITASIAISSIRAKLGVATGAIASVFRRAALLIGGWLGYAIVGAIAAIGANNIVSFLANVVTADRKDTGVPMKWYGVGFYSASYY